MKTYLTIFLFLLGVHGLYGQTQSPVFNLTQQQTKKAFGPAATFIDSIFLRINSLSKKSGKKLLVKNNPSVYKTSFFTQKNFSYYYEMIGRSYLATLDYKQYLRAVDSFAQNFRYADIEVALAQSKTSVKEGFFLQNDSAATVKPYYDSLVQEFCGKIYYFGKPQLYSQVDKGVNFCQHLKELIQMNRKEPGLLRKEE